MRDFGFLAFVAVVWLCTVQATPAFAMSATRGTASDALVQQRFVAVSVPSARLSHGSMTSVERPEPGILAALGCGLLVLGIARWRSGRAVGILRRRVGSQAYITVKNMR